METLKVWRSGVTYFANGGQIGVVHNRIFSVILEQTVLTLNSLGTVRPGYTSQP